ncbi:hypothetical protein KBB59_00420 [Candidatus Woesebacteria bacterium]|jgi:hypothetical protein|nr:hypothetical protein [Candidatus Woesebacteria bacterium]HNV45260.1 hypothetical protein [Candidatus Woesebacteria bacterium]HOC07619.1 hypothetical protein [Candidatus Woesebacteria bacterium]HOI04927.1 hypothetical protein [Candidatus Woesebacteria bacterium]HOP38979.1 hypothetical protein [Candidatus Woesebacteria bacterium]
MNKERARLKQELNRLRRQKSILWAGILFLVAVLIWTAVSILTSQKQVKIDQQLTELAKPLIPRLDVEVFSMIEEKRAITDEELSIFPIYVYLVSGDEKRGEIGVFTDISNLATNSAMLDQEVLVEEASF